MWRSHSNIPWFGKLATIAVVCILMACFAWFQYTTNRYEISKIMLVPSCNDSSGCETGGLDLKGEIEQKPGKAAETKRNLMFIKTHKCGTSSLVNVFYLFGVRRRLNYVIQREKSHQLALYHHPDKDRLSCICISLH